MPNPKNLTSFKPGQSGNSAGRPKGIPNTKTRMRRLLELTEKIKNPVTGELEEFTIMEQLDMQLIAKARMGNLRAYKEIVDRIEGKATQAVDMTSGRGKLESPIIYLPARHDNSLKS